jgi:hypothetical protein
VTWTLLQGAPGRARVHPGQAPGLLSTVVSIQERRNELWSRSWVSLSRVHAVSCRDVKWCEQADANELPDARIPWNPVAARGDLGDPSECQVAGQCGGHRATVAGTYLEVSRARRGVRCGAEHYERLRAGDAGAPSDRVDDSLEVVKVGYAQAYEGVGVARDRESLDEFWEVDEGPVDVVNLRRSVEVKLCEGLDPVAQLGVVDYRLVPEHDLELLEPIDPPLRTSRRKADPAADVRGRTASVLEQQHHDRMIGLVEQSARHARIVTV